MFNLHVKETKEVDNVSLKYLVLSEYRVYFDFDKEQRRLGVSIRLVRSGDLKRTSDLAVWVYFWAYSRVLSIEPKNLEISIRANSKKEIACEINSNEKYGQSIRRRKGVSGESTHFMEATMEP